METTVHAVVISLFCLFAASTAMFSSPKVQIYSREPGYYEKENTLICHVSGFHPPEITIELLSGDNVIPGSKQTDLAFEENWSYHLTKHVPFTPKAGDRFSCRVTHMGKTSRFSWEPDM